MSHCNNIGGPLTLRPNNPCAMKHGFISSIDIVPINSIGNNLKVEFKINNIGGVLRKLDHEAKPLSLRRFKRKVDEIPKSGGMSHNDLIADIASALPL